MQPEAGELSARPQRLQCSPVPLAGACQQTNVNWNKCLRNPYYYYSTVNYYSTLYDDSPPRAVPLLGDEVAAEQLKPLNRASEGLRER